MKKNLIFIRAGDESLHPSWAVARSRRHYDLFISYFGNNPGRFQKECDYYEVAPGLKYPVLAKVLADRPELLSYYDAIWAPDDDLLASPDVINRMFELFHQHKLLLAQPGLASGSYCSFPITKAVAGQTLHFTRFVEVMCPIFSGQTLRKLLPTFRLNASSWGLDYLWTHQLGYPEKRVAVLDETPVVHTRPVGKGQFYKVLRQQKSDPGMEHQQLMQRFGIDCGAVRSHVSGIIPKAVSRRTKPSYPWTSLFHFQELVTKEPRAPIFYENRSGTLQPSATAVLLKPGDSDLIARDFIEHWTARQTFRRGKALILGLNRQHCLQLYNAIVRQRPKWKILDNVRLAYDSGAPAPGLLERFSNPADPLKVVLTDNFWTCPFGGPLLNTIYSTVPIPRPHQRTAVRRLTELFQDRLATLLVDYSGLYQPEEFEAMARAYLNKQSMENAGSSAVKDEAPR
jgi:hypothetical protein